MQACGGASARGVLRGGPATPEKAVGKIECCLDVARGGGGPEIYWAMGLSRIREEVGISGAELGAEPEGREGTGVLGGGG